LGSFSSQSSPWLSAVRKENKKEIKDEIEEDSLGSDSVFGDDLTEDEVEEFETDSELEDGFDDDYSFCEASRRPVSRCERQPRFASFDSCDMSIVEAPDDVRPPTTQRGRPSPRNIRKQTSMQDGVTKKKRLTKTYSEPRHTKLLPPWIERGRSGYIPQRQLSAPGEQSKEMFMMEGTQRRPLPLPDSADVSIDDCNSQGTPKDLPSGEKRARFCKQKTIHGSSSGLLAPPHIQLSKSCERLAESPTPEDSPTTVVNMPLSPSSSQETLC